MSNILKVPFHAPLNPKDSATQTFGCRQKNPNICGNNSLPNVCAFTCDDFICKKPSKAWKKQYEKLREQNN